MLLLSATKTLQFRLSKIVSLVLHLRCTDQDRQRYALKQGLLFPYLESPFPSMCGEICVRSCPSVRFSENFLNCTPSPFPCRISYSRHHYFFSTLSVLDFNPWYSTLLCLDLLLVILSFVRSRNRNIFFFFLISHTTHNKCLI